VKYKLKKLLTILLLILTNAAGFTQDRNAGTVGASGANGAFMVPSKIYVGDRASLILPLPGFAVSAESVTASAVSPSADIEIHRAFLERRPGGSRLTIEFSAYSPGILELPPVIIEEYAFSGLKIEVSSILEQGIAGTVLSGPALPLAIPGTSLLVYGTIISILFSLAVVFWILFWGRARIKGWFASWKKRLLLSNMRGTEKRLRRALERSDDTRRNILDALSTEFRGFLAVFTGESCRAMTASEFANIGLQVETVKSGFLKDFFRRCDGIRFGGGTINKNDALSILDDLKQFLAALEKKEALNDA